MMKKCSVVPVMLSLIFVISESCSGTGNRQQPPGADSSKSYFIPDPGKISAVEAARIHANVQLFYDTILSPSNFNGGILVAQKGNILFEKYRGTAALDGKEIIDSLTSFQIASTSKTFTAMCVLKLQEEGKINIDEPLAKYFPEFNYPKITVKTLLNHRSGLPNYLYFMEDIGWDKKVPVQNADVLKWLINKKGLIKNIGVPDRGFSYSNTNYVLLALLIEKMTGTSYPDFIQKNVFDALDMKHSFVHHQGDSMLRTKTFDWKGGEIPDNFLDETYGDKNIYSTPRDLLRWDRALSDNLFLKKETLELAYTPNSNEKPGIRNYGLGWRMNLYDNGKKMIYHNGWWHGNNTAFIRLLDEDATIILISNRYSRAVYKASYLANIFDRYFEGNIEESEGAEIKTDTSEAKKASSGKLKIKVSSNKALSGRVTSKLPVKKKGN